MGNFESMSPVALVADAAKNEEDANVIRQVGFLLGLATQTDDNVNVSAEAVGAALDALSQSSPFVQNGVAIIGDDLPEELEAAWPLFMYMLTADVADVDKLVQDDAARAILDAVFESPKCQEIVESLAQYFDYDKIMPQEEES